MYWYKYHFLIPELLICHLNKGECECLVCCELIRTKDQTWHCLSCYHVFHLRCIKKWARSPAAAKEGNTYIFLFFCSFTVLIKCQNWLFIMLVFYLVLIVLYKYSLVKYCKGWFNTSNETYLVCEEILLFLHTHWSSFLYRVTLLWQCLSLVWKEENGPWKWNASSSSIREL